MLVLLLFDNSIWSKLLIQYPVIAFWILCSLWYRLFRNQLFSFCELYFRVQRWLIVVLWARKSVRCLHYLLFKTKNCWCSNDVHFQDVVRNISCTALAEKAGTTLYIHYCYKARLRIPKMQDQKLMRLCWDSFSGWGRECAIFVFATKGS